MIRFKKYREIYAWNIKKYAGLLSSRVGENFKNYHTLNYLRTNRYFY